MKHPISLLLLSLLMLNSRGEDPRPPEVESLQPGVRLVEIASHPDLATPTGIDVDEAGNIWLVSCHTHMPKDDYPGPESDEILVFGKNGTRRVFYTGTHHTMDLELGDDGWVYLAERDRIFRVRDSDGDGVGDEEENLATLETESDYPHNGLAALAWNGQGELCFGLGENFAKRWVLTGADGASLTGYGEGGIFRIRRDGKELHRIARGMWNPFGLCVREDGAMFAAENDPGERPPCRLLHIVEGGDYGYQRRYGPSAHHPFVCWNGELRGTLPMVHPTGEAPCGVTPLGRGLIVPSWSDHRIDFFPLTRKGASWTAKRIALVQGARYFRPVCIAAAPSERENLLTWYLTDWVDGRYQVHGYGRLWKLEIDLEKAGWIGPMDLEAPDEVAVLAEKLRNGGDDYFPKELARWAADEDPFLARAAMQALSGRAGDWTAETLENWPVGDRAPAVLALRLGKADPEKWVRPLLADPDPEIRFEALRWIAVEELKVFLPEVEALLRRSDLEFRLFEAAVAARNILLGKPEAGVRDPEMLLSRVKDPGSPPELRAWALRLLPEQPRVAGKDGGAPVRRFPRGLTLELLRELLDTGSEALSLEAVRTLAGNPRSGQALLAEIAADESRSSTLRAEAVAGLGPVADQHRGLLFRLVKSAEPAVGGEALRSLRALGLSPEEKKILAETAAARPEMAGSVEALLDPASVMRGRPPLDDTDAWLKRLDALPGEADPEAGRRIFHHVRIGLCANCHRHEGRGNVVGPDLTEVGDRGDRRWLLESILDPNAEIAPEYLPRTVTLKDGTTFTGIRLRSSTREAMRDSHGQNRTFDRDDIESMEELQVSFMPAGLPMAMTDRELRDLLAFLE